MASNASMQALLLSDVAHLEVRSVPTPPCGPHDVRIRVEAVGLCGTDFHIFSGHANYHMDPSGRRIPLSEQAQILGHEITGSIVEAGAAVQELARGDRVVVDQGLNCHSRRRPLCEYCASGNSHQCEEYAEHGITGLPGALAQYLVVPAVNAIAVQSALDPAEAALTEPLGCVIHAADMASHGSARYTLGRNGAARLRNILICGAGPAGLLFVQYLRNIVGFEGLLIVCERNPTRRRLAARIGATVIDPGVEDLPVAVQELTEGRRIELLIDAAGSGEFFRQIPGLIRRQATLVLYGHGHRGVDLGILNSIQFFEPTLIAPVGASGGFGADHRPQTYRRALSLLQEGRIRVTELITHRYRTLEQIPHAFQQDHRSDDYIKGIALMAPANSS